MRKKKTADELTTEELRQLLIEKRRASRQDRLEYFRRTGRVVRITPDNDSSSLEDLRSGEILEDSEPSEFSSPRPKKRRLLDGLLFAIEVIAVGGLLFILYNGINLIRELNQEVVTVLVQPTLTPTPLIDALVLPSGHTPPTSPQGARPNDAEIPEHLRPLVQSLANIPIPTSGPEQALRIAIPAIGIDAPIVQGDGWEQLKKGVGQHVGTTNPGQSGNVVLSAHNDIFGEIFRNLDRLKSGDIVTLYTAQNAYNYVVSGTNIVEPTQVEVMESTNQPTLSLISCYPYLVDNQRIVVFAHLQSESN